MRTKTIFTSIITLISLSTLALKSPIPSSITGVELPNAHYISQSKNLIRGMAPKGYYDELLSLGVSKVLIFKKQSRKEVDQEIETLKELGFSNSDILHIPFLWHDFESQEVACEQTVKALNFMIENEREGETVFLHCTVGEDRTGHLSGLYRILKENWTMTKAFKEEMCERGYGRGNKNKPSYVVGEIRSDLTPIFLKMAKILKGKYQPGKKLSPKLCEGIEEVKYKAKKCRWSSAFTQD